MSEKRTGGPPQREQVSRRRNRRDVGDEVGDPWRPSHKIKQWSLSGIEAEPMLIH